MPEQPYHAEHPRHGTGSLLIELSDESLIAGRPLRKLLGNCSEMHIWRLLNEEKYQALAFPKPIKINDRNYWRLGAIRHWIREREVQSRTASKLAVRVRPQSKTPAAPRMGNYRKQIRPKKQIATAELAPRKPIERR